MTAVPTRCRPAVALLALAATVALGLAIHQLCLFGIEFSYKFFWRQHPQDDLLRALDHHRHKCPGIGPEDGRKSKVAARRKGSHRFHDGMDLVLEIFYTNEIASDGLVDAQALVRT